MLAPWSGLQRVTCLLPLLCDALACSQRSGKSELSKPCFNNWLLSAVSSRCVSDQTAAELTTELRHAGARALLWTRLWSSCQLWAQRRESCSGSSLARDTPSALPSLPCRGQDNRPQIRLVLKWCYQVRNQPLRLKQEMLSSCIGHITNSWCLFIQNLLKVLTIYLEPNQPDIW